MSIYYLLFKLNFNAQINNIKYNSIKNLRIKKTEN